MLAVVDEELGFSEQQSKSGRGATWVVLYVVNNSVAGCLVAEPVDRAYRVVPSVNDVENNELADDDMVPESELLCCSTDAVPVKFGVSRVWVRSDSRRMGIASRMVDAFRGHMVAFHYLGFDDFAFSDPTPSGVRFARSYTKAKNFLVYRHDA